MKTLKQLDLDKEVAANYASYLKNKDQEFIYCGWMDLHNDYDALGDSNCPFFCLKPVFWDENAVFVVTQQVGGQFILTKQQFLRSGQEFFAFDALNEHGLLTVELAEKYLNNGVLNESDADYKKFVELANKRTKPKMVWEWVQVIDISKTLFRFHKNLID